MKTPVTAPRRRVAQTLPPAQTLTLDLETPPASTKRLGKAPLPETAPPPMAASTQPAPKASPAKKTAPVEAPVPKAVKAASAPKSMPSKAQSTPKPVARQSSKPVPAMPSKASAPPKKTPSKPATAVRVKPAAAEPEAAPVRVVRDVAFDGGQLWKMSGRHSVAYVRDAVVAGELLAVEPKRLAQQAMAVYYDKKGKPFAWQVRFDTERWEEVVRRLA